jgi:hypothetical protein
VRRVRIQHDLQQRRDGGPSSIASRIVSIRPQRLAQDCNPYGLGPDANTGALSLREHAAQAAQDFARAKKALEKARNFLCHADMGREPGFHRLLATGEMRLASDRRAGRPCRFNPHSIRHAFRPTAVASTSRTASSFA